MRDPNFFYESVKYDDMKIFDVENDTKNNNNNHNHNGHGGGSGGGSGGGNVSESSSNLNIDLIPCLKAMPSPNFL